MTEGQIRAGGVWAIPSEPRYWVRPADGALVSVRTGRVRRPSAPKGRPGSLVHSLGRTSRTVRSLVAEALGTGAEPVTYVLEGLDLGPEGG